MRPSVLICFVLAVCGSVFAQPQTPPQRNYPAPVEGDYVIKDFHFRSGETLPELKMHYRTIGTLKTNSAGVATNRVRKAVARITLVMKPRRSAAESSLSEARHCVARTGLWRTRNIVQSIQTCARQLSKYLRVDLYDVEVAAGILQRHCVHAPHIAVLSPYAHIESRVRRAGDVRM